MKESVVLWRSETKEKKPEIPWLGAKNFTVLVRETLKSFAIWIYGEFSVGRYNEQPVARHGSCLGDEVDDLTELIIFGSALMA